MWKHISLFTFQLANSCMLNRQAWTHWNWNNIPLHNYRSLLHVITVSDMIWCPQQCSTQLLYSTLTSRDLIFFVFKDQELQCTHQNNIILFSENSNVIIKWSYLHHRPRNGFVKIFIKENIPSFSKIRRVVYDISC